MLVSCGSKAIQPGQALTEAARNTETNVETNTDFSSNDETISQTSYNQELLTHITIKDGFAVADYAESTETDYSYAVYRFLQTNRPVNNAEMYWELERDHSL